MSYTPTYPELDNTRQRKTAARELVQMRQSRDRYRAEAKELQNEDPMMHMVRTQTAYHMASALKWEIEGYRRALKQFFGEY